MTDRNQTDWTPCQPGDVATFVGRLARKKRIASLILVGSALIAASGAGLATWMIAKSFSNPKPREQETQPTRTPFIAKGTRE